MEVVPDERYAILSLALWDNLDPGTVFDRLTERGLITVVPVTDQARERIADMAAETIIGNGSHSVVTATNQAADELNAAIRDRLVAAGVVDDHTTVTGRDDNRIGVGDRVVTRVNDPGLKVANRDAWAVTAISPDGALTVTGTADRYTRTLPPTYVQESVQLGYASTGHGVQGQTTDKATLLHDEYTDGAGQYVGMTRGRTHNTAVIIADTPQQARQQWVTAAGRDRADRGIHQAQQTALAETRQYNNTAGQPAATPTAVDPAAAKATAAAAGGVARYRASLVAAISQYEKQIATIESVAQYEQHQAAAMELDLRLRTRTVAQLAGQAGMEDDPTGYWDSDVQRIKNGITEQVQVAVDHAEQVRQQHIADITRQLPAAHIKVRAAYRAAAEAIANADRTRVFGKAAAQDAANYARVTAHNTRIEAVTQLGPLGDPEAKGDHQQLLNDFVGRQPAVKAADQAAKQAAELAETKLTYIDAARELAQLTSQYRDLAVPAEQRPTHRVAVEKLGAVATALNNLDRGTPEQQTQQAKQWRTEQTQLTKTATTTPKEPPPPNRDQHGSPPPTEATGTTDPTQDPASVAKTSAGVAPDGGRWVRLRNLP
ncbi:hypothetical protein EH165_06535 [Nakamurella antarctica]|uniref:Uncharacterized protein n=1 Tax=Nakamurella antarctica TaxID=1902245 RepID=A0A3G8ZKL8_9ACTN|nr:hypothetical protein [Nakamurella antarctica]AZI57859.1 hypothetical protein EH165_06535 [Nakamurella antarctica]